MGDRILFQVHSKTSDDDRISPVIYGHWCGARGPEICERLQARMKGREGDVQYTAARLVQEMIGDDEGHLSYGMWNATELLTGEDSHGDAGVVLIECTKEGLRFDCLGGYLKASKDRASVQGE